MNAAQGLPKVNQCEGYQRSPHLSNNQTANFRRHADTLQAQLNEADRRAGAAERNLADARETIIRNNQSRSAMKREAGYHENVSFDVVWSDLMTELASLRKFRADRISAMAAAHMQAEIAERAKDASA